MSILDYFRKSLTKPASTANLAKERLQIIVAHERGQKTDYLPLLQEELIQVIGKYVKIDQDQVKVELEHNGECSVLELNIMLPEAPKTTVASDVKQAKETETA